MGARGRTARRGGPAARGRAAAGVLAALAVGAVGVAPASAAPITVRAPAAARSSCLAASDLLSSAPVSVLRPARGVSVRSWNGHDGAGRDGHEIRLSVAQADLRHARLGAAAGRGYGAAADTTQLTAAAGAVVGVNGDYFAYDWSGAAVPYGPLVRGGRILRLPPGLRPAVGADAGGRPVAGGVQVSGSIEAAGPRPWSLPVVSVNDDGDAARTARGGRRDSAEPLTTGGGVAVVTPYLGAARPRRAVEVVLRGGVVVAAGRRLPFGARSTWGSGRAGQGDVLLAASGTAGVHLRSLAPGTRVTVRYAARFTAGAAAGSRVRDAVGSGAVLLRGSVNLAPCSGSAVQSRPRTMIAWNARRTTVWFIVVAGRGRGLPVSRYGLTYRQVTQVARALGATDAVMVDGGGSSTMALRHGRDVARIDAPADAPQRPVPDALVFLKR